MGFDDVAAHGETETGAALAAGVGSCLGAEEGIEDSSQCFGGHTAAGVADNEIHRLVRGVAGKPDDQRAAVGHCLARVDQQVQQHLLNLVAVGNRLWNVVEMLFDANAILHHFAFEQQQRVVHQLPQVGWLKRRRSITRKSQNAVGDLRGAVAGGEDLVERFVAGRFVLVSHAHLGVVDDRHQHIVELVRRGADELAKRGQFLGLRQLLAQ